MNWNFTIAKYWIAKVLAALSTAITTTAAVVGASFTTTSNGAVTAHGSGNITTTSGNLNTTSGNLTVGGTATVTGTLTNTNLTATRVPYVSTAGLIKDEAAFTYTEGTDTLTVGSVTCSGTVSAEQLTTTDDLTVQGLATITETLVVTQGITGASVITTANGAITADGSGNISTTSGNFTTAGDITINTNKFTVAGATGNTLVAGTLDVTGDVAVATNKLTITAATGNTAIAGTLTPTGGVVGTLPTRVSNVPVGDVAYASVGTDATHVAGTSYISQLWLPSNMEVAGIGVLNGATVGTDNLIYGIANAAGTIIAWTDLNGTLSAGANAFQQIALAAGGSLVGPALYHLIVQCNGTTAKTRRIAASTYLNAASTEALAAFGTLLDISPPTATSADAGPIGYFYSE